MTNKALKAIGAVIYTIRPSATFGACLLVAAAYQPKNTDLLSLVVLLGCAFFGSSYCFLVNDIFDREKDLLNHKMRPIATGVLPLRWAIGISVLFALLFLGFSYTFGWVVFGLAILFLFLATFYSLVNFQSGFMANFVVAFIVSGTQWGVAFVRPDSYLVPLAVFLFLFTVPREMILDWLDKEGDEAHGKDSLAIKFSTQKFNGIMASFLIAATIALTYLLVVRIPHAISYAFFVASILISWTAFGPFFFRANRKNALIAVRSSHLTFALIILAMFLR